MVQFALALLVVSLVQKLLVTPYGIPSESMEPTLMTGDRILVNRLAGAREDPAVGDVVVFDEPDNWENPPEAPPGFLRQVAGGIGDLVGLGPSNQDPLTKRIAAVPGQVISRNPENAAILIDGQALPEGDSNARDNPASRPADTCSQAQECEQFRVPDGAVLVAGDNRAVSSDSFSPCLQDPAVPLEQCLRLVPRERIIGQVEWIFYPLAHWGPVNG